MRKHPSLYRREKKRRRLPITICAAVLCSARNPDGAEEEILLGISDRMLTSGDIENEAPQSKIYPLGSVKSLCLAAGDAAAHMSVVQATYEQLLKLPDADIREVARVYAASFSALRRKRAEQTHLAPYGLDAATFLAQQRRMNESLVLSLADRMEGEDLGVETIIAGVDSNGPHIYHIADPGVPTCFDGIGFCAIGSGARQFETQLMHQGFGCGWAWHRALLLMYSAKKKAEVSPGVGKATDMFSIRQQGWGFLPQSMQDVLAECHDELEKAAESKRAEVTKRMLGDARFARKPDVQQNQAAPAAPPGEAPQPVAASQAAALQEDVRVISPGSA